MKIDKLEYERKINLGQYEHEIVKVGAVVEEGDDAKKVLAELRKISLSKDGVVSNETVVKNADPSTTASEAKKETPAKSTKVAEQKRVTPEEKKTSDESKAAESAPKEKSKKTAKPSPYDKEIDLHKKKVAEFMDEAFPELVDGKPIWRKKYMDEARATSAEMMGKDFLDSESVVLESFKTEFIAAFEAKLKAKEGTAEEL